MAQILFLLFTAVGAALGAAAYALGGAALLIAGLAAIAFLLIALAAHAQVILESLES